MIRSKDKASGMPEMTPDPEEEMVEPPMDLGFSDPLMELRDETGST